MSIRQRVRDRIDDVREAVANALVGLAGHVYGEPLDAYTESCLKSRDDGFFRAGVEFGKVQAGDPDLFVYPVPVDE